MCYQLKPRRRVFLTDWLDRLIYLWPIYHTPFPLHPPSSSPPSVSTLQLYPSLIIRRQQIIKATTNIDHALSEKSLLTFFSSASLSVSLRRLYRLFFVAVSVATLTDT